MKLTAAREELLAPLQSVIGVVERRQTMPVLANVLLVARDNKLSVTGTDLEVELVATCAVSVQQPGDITVPGRKLLDIFRSLPEKVSVSSPQTGLGYSETESICASTMGPNVLNTGGATPMFGSKWSGHEPKANWWEATEGVDVVFQGARDGTKG